MSFATHLECSLCQKQYTVQRLVNLFSCGSPLLVRYDLRSLQRELHHAELACRPATMWRYFELLPVKEVVLFNTGSGMKYQHLFDFQSK